MTLVLSILAGVSVLVCQWLYGNKSVWGPVVGLVGQVPWLGLIVATGAWGLLVSWVPMTAIHARNLWRWRREAGNGGSHV
jgi:hypothetical protein